MSDNPFDRPAPTAEGATGHAVAVIPTTGELIDLTSPEACASALTELRDLDQRLRAARRELTAALAEYAATIGARTFRLEDGTSVTVGADRETVYDAPAIEQGLRDAGMPEARIREIVVETVTYKIDAVKAKQAARANDAYAAVIDRHSEVVPKAQTAYVRR
jgi:hypothetical protein